MMKEETRKDVTLLIADDHPIFRQGLRGVIETDAGLRVIAEAADGEQALRAVETLRPQIAVLDVDMPNKDGFEVARAVREKRLKTEIIFLTMYKDEKFFHAALDHGAKGYVLKDTAATEIVTCIRLVAAGQNYVSPQLSTYLIGRLHRHAEFAEQNPRTESLTATERKILKRIAEYRTSKQIADELCLSVRTIEHHRANISEKLDLKGSHALIKFAIEHQSEL